MPAAPDAPAEMRLSTIAGVALLGLAALAAALYGMARPAQSVERVARQFLQAVIDGDRATARTLLSEELRHADEARTPSEPWKRQTGAGLKIESVSLGERQATVVAVLSRNGYDLRPTLKLEQTGSGAWQIFAIGGLAQDPSWLRDREVRSNEVLAEDIARALEVPLQD